MEATGLDTKGFFENSFKNIENQGKAINAELDKLMADGKEINQGDMLKVQYHLGMYNAMMEAVSSVTKSMTDMMKNLAQRSS